MIQYIAIPATGGGYTLYNTHRYVFTMVELKTIDTEGPNIGSSKGYSRTSRHITQHNIVNALDSDLTNNAVLTDAVAGTVLAIINKNGHVTPICDPTP